MRKRRTAALTLAILVLAACLTVAGLTSSFGGTGGGAATVRGPNIVFILTDDLSWNLVSPVRTPNIVALEKRGETFNHYFVTDSLCCPSRSTILTGLFPHDSKVFTNLAPDGGFDRFQAQHLDSRTWAVALRRRGYRTSLMGKYLNGYGQPQMTPATAPIPPGWSDWHVSDGTGYLEFNYRLNDNGKYNQYGGPTGGCGVTGTPDNYLVDVLNGDAQSFIGDAGRNPFALEVAPFIPHSPFTPAPRNACDFPGLTQPRDPSFNAPNTHPPAWLAKRGPLSAADVAKLDGVYRLRSQAMESVDKLVADVQAKLAAAHLLKNTYIVFTSDNGYHLGQHFLPHGKQTAFDTDIRVPLIVAGPGVPHGKTVSRVAQNTDLYPTFLQLAGASSRAPFDGHSLVPLLHPPSRRPAWRTVALVEHHHSVKTKGDPDAEGGRAGNPTSYEAIRISSRHLPAFKRPVEAVYVEYRDAAHELEYYDIRKDPFERHNIANRLTTAQRRELHRVLTGLEHCHNAKACWKAGLPAR